MKTKRMCLNIAAFIALCMAAQSASSAVVSIEPSYLNILQGDIFTVNITVYPAGDEVMGAQYELLFNNTLLNATEQAQGTFLSQDGVGTSVYKNEINNTIGVVKYGEARSGVDYGMTTPGILATITFRAVEAGTGSLNLSKAKLSDPVSGSISTEVNNATVEINEMPKFTISGFVEYDNGDPVPDPDVVITNLNTSEVFVAETNASSNRYQVSTNFAHISSDDVLNFNATDDLGNVTVFNHTITQDEIDAGGFVQNITLYIPDTIPPVITNISIVSVTKDSATITWETDELSDSLVKYGTEPENYTETAYNATDAIYHSIDIVGLIPNTTYYYVVNSTDENTNSAQSTEQNFKTFPEIIVTIGDAVAMTGNNATTSVAITNVTNVGTTDITLTYNQSVVHVVAVDGSGFDFMGTDIDNAAGRTRIGAFQTVSGGLDGAVVVANVTLSAVGGGGEFTALNLTINELKDAGWEEISIPASVCNGSFTVWELTPPLVTGIVADPPSIPEDTDSDPGWGETSRLNVTVTDECDVASVTINLTRIGGLSDQTMTHLPGTDVWTVTVNASIGSAIYNVGYLPHNLAVRATDAFGNVNTSASIPLTVILNGDVSESGDVTLYDATYLANHILNNTGFETMNARVADVSNNGAVSFYDAMYLSKHILAEFGFEVLR